jgi:hypothetical protein
MCTFLKYTAKNQDQCGPILIHTENSYRRAEVCYDEDIVYRRITTSQMPGIHLKDSGALSQQDPCAAEIMPRSRHDRDHRATSGRMRPFHSGREKFVLEPRA